MDNVIAIRNPAFGGLQHDIAFETARLTQAAQAKQRFLVELGSQHAITLEDRHKFIELLKAEQEAYHAMHHVQEKFLQLLRVESQAGGPAEVEER